MVNGKTEASTVREPTSLTMEQFTLANILMKNDKEQEKKHTQMETFTMENGIKETDMAKVPTSPKMAGYTLASTSIVKEKEMVC